MKRILIIADRDLGNSGVPAVIMSIVRGLHTKYIFDIVVFEETNNAFVKEFISYGGKIIVFNINKPSSVLKRIEFYLFGYSRQIFKEFNAKVNISNYFLIHSFKGIFSAPFLKYAKKHGIKKRILHINGVYDKNPKFHLELLNKRNKHNCIKYSNIKLAVSNMAGSSFFGKVNFECVFNPINDCFYKKLPPFYETLSLTQIGTYSDRKNQLFSIEVFKKVKEKCPNAVLNFLGYEVEYGYLEKMRAAINKYNLNHCVRYYDHAYNQIDLIKETTICLFPSKSEAFGLVAVENQACNRPVVCSKAIIEEIDCGAAFYLDFNSEKWADIIVDIYKNKRQFHIDTSVFNSESFCKKIDSLYRNN